MVGERPGANSRGRGGKFRKFTRGGGKHFSRDLRPLDAEGNEVSMWADGANQRGENEEDDGDEEEEESDEAPGPSTAPTMTREERKKEKKSRKEAAIAKSQGKAIDPDNPWGSDDDDDGDDGDATANPNHSDASRKQAQGSTSVQEVTDGIKDIKVSGTPSRRERESMEAQLAKERYRKLHESGKTDEAKADLARLKIIREKREAEAARKQAEKDEKEALQKAKRVEIEAKEAKKREAALGPSKGKGKK